jgi:hypothetical protein
VKRSGIGARVSSALVFLCELEDLDGGSEDDQLYVGMSRARNHCVIVAPRARSRSAADASLHFSHDRV